MMTHRSYQLLTFSTLYSTNEKLPCHFVSFAIFPSVKRIFAFTALQVEQIEIEKSRMFLNN
ncbi:CLUMA_CG020534, isoform A [Clunio marinus]|uniref:CLUMA_CG020534, isoform A n=1 Tax=Clunio marinus TaxID=568069 RepID=A0A1J1J986_9DIPT|nr:CLUMA_CG020534, isoform A [Clunio marinus]